MLSWEYPPLIVGGLGRHVHSLAEAMASAGHAVTIVTRHSPGAALDETVRGVRIVRAPEDPPQFAFEEATLLPWAMALNHALTRAALAVVDDVAPEVVHAHDWLVAHAATTLKHHLGVPLVATIHATEAGRHQGWLPGALQRSIHGIEWWLTYQARRVITCSDYMRWEVRRLFELGPEGVTTIVNGVDLPAWRCEPEKVAAMRVRFGGEGPLLLFTGRLVYEKGVQDLLRALPRLRRRHPGLRLVVAGDGPHGAELRALARQLRLGRGVRWAGFLSHRELVALTAAADCAVVPSLYEPFGLVALEAAAAGVPLVVADTGGLREVVDAGRTGLRFPAGDVSALVECIDEVLRDEVSARRRARAAHAGLVPAYSWSTVADRTVAEYHRAVREEWAQHAGTVRARPPRSISLSDGNLLAEESS
jgi:glycogen(starch) synthase